MSHNFSHSGCVYLDTSMLCGIIEHPEWYRPLFNFLFNDRLYIALSDSLLVELSQVKRERSEINNLFTLLPSAKIKDFEAVIDEEVESYPKKRTEPLLSHPLSLEVDKQTIDKWLISDEVREAQERQLFFTKKMRQQLDSVKSHLPKLKENKYAIEQSKLFSWLVTVQWLTASHPTFMKELNNNAHVLNVEAFPSIQLYSLYIYYKYYLGNREPKEISEFGGLFHLFHFPYCKLIIVEREMHNFLNKIKNNCKLLQDTEVRSFDFFKNSIFVKRQNKYE